LAFAAAASASALKNGFSTGGVMIAIRPPALPPLDPELEDLSLDESSEPQPATTSIAATASARKARRGCLCTMRHISSMYWV
jgi:hypothetical protein